MRVSAAAAAPEEKEGEVRGAAAAAGTPALLGEEEISDCPPWSAPSGEQGGEWGASADQCASNAGARGWGSHLGSQAPGERAPPLEGRC